MSKRVAIVGTAASWIKTPWSDPSLKVWGLNDGYLCRDKCGNTMPRADAWFELHPLDKLYYRRPDQKRILASDVPSDHYVRPDGHIEWLKTQAKTIPVYLQKEPPADWPANAQRYPLEHIEAIYGTYWASGPSYMVALAMEQGFTEIQVYGIHLATQHEYIEQRSNFEHLLGIAKGKGITVTMADESPVLKHGWKYAYEPKPQGKPNPLAAELHQVQKAKSKLIHQLVEWPRFKSKAAPMEALRRATAHEIEIQQRLQSMQGCGTLTAVVVAA